MLALEIDKRYLVGRIIYCYFVSDFDPNLEYFPEKLVTYKEIFRKQGEKEFH